MGKRLRTSQLGWKLRQKASHPQFRFRIAVTLATAHYADQFMEQHYWESACKHDESDRQKVKPADDEDLIPREHKDQSATWTMQHRVHKVIAEIWEDLKERGREASPLDVAMKFYQGSDFLARDSEIPTQGLFHFQSQNPLPRGIL